jgi:hypothetical protein
VQGAAPAEAGRVLRQSRPVRRRGPPGGYLPAPVGWTCFYGRSKLNPVNEARADWRRRLLLWNRWLVIVLVAGFVLFSLVFTIVLMVMAR